MSRKIRIYQRFRIRGWEGELSWNGTMFYRCRRLNEGWNSGSGLEKGVFFGLRRNPPGERGK